MTEISGIDPTAFMSFVLASVIYLKSSYSRLWHDNGKLGTKKTKLIHVNIIKNHLVLPNIISVSCTNTGIMLT